MEKLRLMELGIFKRDRADSTFRFPFYYNKNKTSKVVYVKATEAKRLP
jgi:hypothetical protein